MASYGLSGARAVSRGTTTRWRRLHAARSQGRHRIHGVRDCTRPYVIMQFSRGRREGASWPASRVLGTDPGGRSVSEVQPGKVAVHEVAGDAAIAGLGQPLPVQLRGARLEALVGNPLMHRQEQGGRQPQLVAVTHHQIPLIAADPELECLQCESVGMTILVPDFKHDMKTPMKMYPRCAIARVLTSVRSDSKQRIGEEPKSENPAQGRVFLNDGGGRRIRTFEGRAVRFTV